jgi:hypothetical protein
MLIGCGPSGPPAPPAPGESAFKEANRNIDSDDDGVAHGNTEQAKNMAADFSELMEQADKALFSGGSESAIDLTGEKFLTYCQVSGNKVAFLVQVPEFKQYKDEVRDALISLAWLTANRVVNEASLTGVEKIGVGLRGMFLYGGLAIGPPGEEPEKTDAGFTVEDELLYEFFAEPASANEPGLDESAGDQPAGDDPQKATDEPPVRETQETE